MEDVAAILRKRRRDTINADTMGGSLDPADFTRYFADKPKPHHSVAVRHFTLEPSMRDKLQNAIMKAKRGKAPGPDGIPAEIYQLAQQSLRTEVLRLRSRRSWIGAKVMMRKETCCQNILYSEYKYHA